MVHNVICAKNTLWLWSSQIFMMTQNTQKRFCWHCNIWPDYFFPTNHITVYMTWQWHIGVYEEMFDVNRTIAQTMQNIWDFIVGKLILPKKWQTRAIIQEIQSKIWSLLDPHHRGNFTLDPPPPPPHLHGFSIFAGNWWPPHPSGISTSMTKTSQPLWKSSFSERKTISIEEWGHLQCSPCQVVTGKIYRLKQHFLPSATSWSVNCCKKYASCDPSRSPQEKEVNTEKHSYSP